MKPDQMYQELKDLAEKLQITVSEQSFRQAGIRVRSGLCKVKGRQLFIMDKHKSIHRKIKMLARCLAAREHEQHYVVPAVRELLEKHAPEASLFDSEDDAEDEE
jgi:hypothetical protein